MTKTSCSEEINTKENFPSVFLANQTLDELEKKVSAMTTVPGIMKGEESTAIQSLRDQFHEIVEKYMRYIVPNLTKVVGCRTPAKFIKHAGRLTDLHQVTSSLV